MSIILEKYQRETSAGSLLLLLLMLYHSHFLNLSKQSTVSYVGDLFSASLGRCKSNCAQNGSSIIS